jgi:hypothetical protein
MGEDYRLHEGQHGDIKCLHVGLRVVYNLLP